ncbi:hypothetical protein F5Y05DRAFT_381218 [Hypoxylon sp. FL0543]|nr:hypothetical protein F5Y05DRAFT_381218 [Hypoxylon sp. FL0543]
MDILIFYSLLSLSVLYGAAGVMSCPLLVATHPGSISLAHPGRRSIIVQRFRLETCHWWPSAPTPSVYSIHTTRRPRVVWYSGWLHFDSDLEPTMHGQRHLGLDDHTCHLSWVE